MVADSRSATEIESEYGGFDMFYSVNKNGSAGGSANFTAEPPSTSVHDISASRASSTKLIADSRSVTEIESEYDDFDMFYSVNKNGSANFTAEPMMKQPKFDKSRFLRNCYFDFSKWTHFYNQRVKIHQLTSVSLVEMKFVL